MPNHLVEVGKDFRRGREFTYDSDDDLESLGPFHDAARNGNVDHLRNFLRRQGEVDACAGAMKVTPLLLACYGGHHECAKLLVGAHASVHVTDVDNLTPLDAACVEGHVRCVTVLLDAKADVNACQSSESWTPLHRTYACNPHFLATAVWQHQSTVCALTCEQVCYRSCRMCCGPHCGRCQSGGTQGQPAHAAAPRLRVWSPGLRRNPAEFPCGCCSARCQRHEATRCC